MSILVVSCGENSSEERDLTYSKNESLDESKVQSTSNSWHLVDTVDDFGKQTGNSVIAATFQGTMKNSATTDSPLLVRAQLVNGQIYMQFFEYGRIPADMPNSKFIYISVRKPDGSVEYAGQFIWQGYMTDSGYLPGSDRNFSKPEWRTLSNYQDGTTKDNQLLELLLEETEPITVRVDMSWADRINSSVYIFDMDNSGLNELINSPN